MDIGCIQVGTKELLDRGQALTGLRRSCDDVFAVSEYPSKNLLDNKSSIQSQFKAYLIQAILQINQLEHVISRRAEAFRRDVFSRF